jgi:hypothetical protein
MGHDGNDTGGVMTLYAAYSKATGALRTVLTDLAYLQEGEGYAVVPAGTETEFADWSPTTKTFTPNLERLKRFLIDGTKRDSERRSMMYLSEGGAKKFKLGHKAEEIASYQALGGTLAVLLTALTPMSAAARMDVFGFAIEDATERGEITSTSTPLQIAAGVDKAIKRFIVGAGSSLPNLRKIEAIEQRVCDAIRAASSPAAARAAASATNWPTPV